MMMIFVPLCALLGYPDDLPARLRAVFASPAYRTSESEWTISWYSGPDAGLVERCVTKFAGGSTWESNLGDENNFHYTSHYLPPARGAGPEESEKSVVPRANEAGIRNKLLYQDQAWNLRHAERPVSGFVVPAKDASFYGPVQLPSIGLAHSFADEPYATPFQLNPFDGEGLANATFREYQDNGLPAVVAEWGNTTLTWIFDHEQGGMPVQAMLHRGDSLASYSRSTYQNVGGRWFPKATGFFDGSNQLLKRVEIQRVTFDRPEHLQEITPVEFGALSGTQFGGPSGLLWWNGVELVPDDEFLPLLWLDPTIMDDRIAQFMVEDTDRTVEQYRAALRQSGDALRERYKREYGEELKLKKTAEKDPWDVYVDEFVSKHKFPEAPTKKAFEIRDSAKKLRDTQRLRDAADMRKAKREGDKRKLEEFEKREKKIYDRLLVRPLDRLAAAVAKSSETQTTP